MPIDILQHQADFINSNCRHTGLVGGYRSGKSHAGTIKTIMKKVAMPNIDVAYYLPTYPLIKDIAFPKFSEFLTALNIPYTLNRTDKDINTPYGRIIFRSMDNPDLIIGYEVGYSLVDEADVLPKDKMKDVMAKIIARNSFKSERTNNATDFVSTPEGFRFLYEFFVENPSPNKKLIKASTRNNPFISDDYVNSLEEQYTAQQLRAYLDGDFVNLTSGSVYHSYDRNTNDSSREIQDKDMLHVGVDFNMMNMSAVIHVKEGLTATAVAEITRCYDTKALCEELKYRYPKHLIVVYPDASGSNRKTSASMTDVDIMKGYGFIVKKTASNPLVKDRINVMNNAFEKLTYKVNHMNCPAYANCLEQLPFKGNEPDKSLGLDHLPDAGGYFAWWMYGMKPERAKLTSRKR